MITEARLLEDDRIARDDTDVLLRVLGGGDGLVAHRDLADLALGVEAQDDETTKAEGMAVLRKMFPNVTIPEPTAFMYPIYIL